LEIYWREQNCPRQFLVKLDLLN